MKKAEDTVMKSQDAIDAYNHFREKYVEEQEALEMPVVQSQADNAGINAHSLAQAKITWPIAFKAGYEEALKMHGGKYYQAGRKEVVEWIEEHSNNEGYKGMFYQCIELEPWQAQKKKWGIDAKL